MVFTVLELRDPSKTLVLLRVPELKYGKYHMIWTLPGGIPAAEASTRAYICIASKTSTMLHILHILPFPEPRFVNLGFSGIPGIRKCGYPDIEQGLNIGWLG